MFNINYLSDTTLSSLHTLTKWPLKIPYKVATIFCLIFQTGKPKHKGINCIVKSYKTRDQKNKFGPVCSPGAYIPNRYVAPPLSMTKEKMSKVIKGSSWVISVFTFVSGWRECVWDSYGDTWSAKKKKRFRQPRLTKLTRLKEKS